MKVVICGAGVAGLTLAWCLERRGHRPIVVDAAPRLPDAGHFIDFFGPGVAAAERLGLLPDFAAIQYPIERLTFVNEAGRPRFSIRYRPLRRRLFRNRQWSFVSGDLQQVLYDRLKGRDRIRFGTTVASFEQDHDQVRVSFTDGTVESADALVGADGRHSRVRTLAFGEGSRFLRPLGYQMAAYIIDQPLMSLRTSDVFWTLTLPTRQVSIYQIRDGRTAAFLVHAGCGAPDTAAGVHGRLRQIYGDLAWVVPEVVDGCATAESVSFDAVEQIVMPSWSRGRVTLLGEACWGRSPMDGQGASMAMAGAYALAEEIDCGEVGLAFTQYERRVRPVIERQQAAGRTMAKWFVPRDRVHRIARDAIVRVSSWPFVAPVLRQQIAAATIARPAG
jgi:2-polyprenyl-6-methoxyphenol hydroxylase-like FAD-dependent oxidoreductase